MTNNKLVREFLPGKQASIIKGNEFGRFLTVVMWVKSWLLYPWYICEDAVKFLFTVKIFRYYIFLEQICRASETTNNSSHI